MDGRNTPNWQFPPSYINPCKSRATTVPYRVSHIEVCKVNQLWEIEGSIFFFELWCIVGSGGLEIWVLSCSSKKSNIGWPQQLPTERVLKSNIIFHDSTKAFCFSKHQSKAKFKNLDETEVLSSEFPSLTTSANWIISLNNLSGFNDSTASFQQNFYSAWQLDHP